jgi:hypothetical protein
MPPTDVRSKDSLDDIRTFITGCAVCGLLLIALTIGMVAFAQWWYCPRAVSIFTTGDLAPCR